MPPVLYSYLLWCCWVGPGQHPPGHATGSISAMQQLSRCHFALLRGRDGAEVPGTEMHLRVASTAEHSTAHTTTCGTTEASVHPPALSQDQGTKGHYLPITERLSNKHRALSRVTFGDRFRARSWVPYLDVSEQHHSNPPKSTALLNFPTLLALHFFNDLQ